MTIVAKELKSTHVVEYSVSDAAIDKLRERYTGLTIANTADYERVRVGIGELRDIRVQVEKTRVELKADALAYGRKVDAEAKRITSLLLEIEEPLKLEKQKVDEEKARVKREKEEAERAKIEAELKAKREAEEAEAARIKAEQEAIERAERERIAAEQKAEAERLAKERAALEAERAAAEAERLKAQAIIDEQNRLERERIEAEQAKLREERERLAREQFEREAKERAEREAREKLEREAAEARRRAEIEEEEREHRAAMAPDFVKLAEYAKAILAIPSPDVNTSEAVHYLHHANEHLNQAVELLHDFAAKYGK